MLVGLIAVDDDVDGRVEEGIEEGREECKKYRSNRRKIKVDR